MTKKEKLEELKRLFHIAHELGNEKPHDIYAQGYAQGKKMAYMDAINLLTNKKEKENVYDWLWNF